MRNRLSFGHDCPRYEQWQRRSRRGYASARLKIAEQRQILMNKRDGHAALAHSARYAFDRVVADVTGAKDAGQAGFERKRMARLFPGAKIAPSADIPAGIAL